MINIFYLKLFSKIIVSALILLFIFQVVGVELYSMIDGVSNWHYLIVPFFASLSLIPLISANRWKLFLRLSGIQESTKRLLYLIFLSNFQGFMLPGLQGGDLFRVYHIEKMHPGKIGVAGSTVFAERILGLLVLCLLSLFSLPFIPVVEKYLHIVVVVLAMNALVATSLWLVLSDKVYNLYSGRQVSSSWASKLLRYLTLFHSALIRFPYKDVLLSSVLLIVCFQLLIIMVLYFVFLAFGYHIPYMQHLAVFPVIAILSMAPITVGGLGVREGLFVYFYGLFGVPSHLAVGVSLLNYTLVTLVPVLFGGVLSLYHYLSLKRVS